MLSPLPLTILILDHLQILVRVSCPDVSCLSFPMAADPNDLLLSSIRSAFSSAAGDPPLFALGGIIDSLLPSGSKALMWTPPLRLRSCRHSCSNPRPG